jgi:hypothetical protein
MEWGRRAATTTAAGGAHPAQLAVPVGASYAFDPGADGISGMYATRVLERGIDPRALCAEVRADRRGIPEHGAVARALLSQPRVMRFGRGTAVHLQVTSQAASRGEHAVVPGSRQATSPVVATGRPARVKWPRRLAVAGAVLLLLLPLTVVL